MTHPICIVPHCNNFSQSKTKASFCNAHYQQKYHGKDPFLAHVKQRPSAKCVAPNCIDLAITGKLCPLHYKRVREGELVIDGITAPPFPQCTGPECEQLGTKVGLCAAHYGQKQRGVELTPVVFQYQQICSVDGCDDHCVGGGMCRIHYYRVARTGSTELVVYPECGEDGCKTRAKNGILCGPHSKARRDSEQKEARRLASLEKRRKELEARRQCDVFDCERTEYKSGSRLCQRHYRDMNEKSLGIDDYLPLMEAVKCEACGQGGIKLVTDHKHGHHEEDRLMCLECIRGRLCNHCNRALGLLGENEAYIEGLLAYIKRFDGDPIRSGRPEDIDYGGGIAVEPVAEVIVDTPPRPVSLYT